MVGLEVFIPFDIDIITTDFNALKEKEHVNIYNDNNTEGVAAATSEGEMDKVTAETPDGKVRVAALLATDVDRLKRISSPVYNPLM